MAQVLDRTDCVIVSPGVRREEALRLGFRYAMSAQEALEMAFERQGGDAGVAVLQHGGHILPLIESEAGDG